jgi:hypothetical protein
MNLRVWNGLSAGDAVMVHQIGSPLAHARHATVIDAQARPGRANLVAVRMEIDGHLAWPDRDTVHTLVADPGCWRCAASGATRHHHPQAG